MYRAFSWTEPSECEGGREELERPFPWKSSESLDRFEALDKDIKNNPPSDFEARADEEDDVADASEPSSVPDPVLQAALRGEPARIVGLLALGCSRKGRTWRHRGALHLAARRGSAATVRVLMQAGCGTDNGVGGGADRYGHTPLHLAARGGHVLAATELLLLRAGEADKVLLDAANRFGDTPLHMAVRNGHFGMATFLLRRGASAVVRNRYGESAHALAAVGPCAASTMCGILMRAVIREARGDSSVLTHALVQAAYAGNSTTTIRLVAAGARQDVTVAAAAGMSAMEAAANGRDPTATVVALVLAGGSGGAFPPTLPPTHSAFAERRDAPLNVLARRGRHQDLPAMTVLLGAAGTDVNFRDFSGHGPSDRTPLQNAATGGLSVAMVNKLLDAGADVNLVGGPLRESALHQAARDMLPSICAALINGGGSVSLRNGNGRTPAQVATRSAERALNTERFGPSDVTAETITQMLAVFRSAGADMVDWPSA